MISSDDIRTEVIQILDASAGCGSADFDVEGIVHDLISRHGLVPVDEIDSDSFWAVVLRHDLHCLGQLRGRD